MVSANPRPKECKEEECIINCLPRDLIERIFLRLPVSTLLRCRGVCKNWYNFIRDPQFVTAHLQRAPPCALLFFPQETVASERYPSDAIILDEAWSQSTWSVPVIGPDDFLCGSCNGLLCLYTRRSTIKIANLATGEYLHLDKPVKSSKSDHSSFYRFGFHPVTKEYKVVHFLGNRGKHSHGTFSVIQVYTLGSEKWKEVTAPEVLSLSCVKNSGAVTVDGTMYWLTDDTGASWKHAVIAFDLSKETFSRIQLPAVAFRGSGPRQYWITEIDKKVCIATAQVYHDHPRMLAGDLLIWTLDNHIEQKWSEWCSVQHASNYIPGPSFVHMDKIMMPSRDYNLYLYDLLGKNCESKLSNMVQLFDFSPRKPEKMQSYICSKSLVRLDAYKNVGVLHRPKQQEGWELERWALWERMLCKFEDTRNKAYRLDQEMASLRSLCMTTKETVQHMTDEVIRQLISTEIDLILQLLPDRPYQHPRSLRRLNWVEQKHDLEKLSAYVDGFKDLAKAHEKLKMALRSIEDYRRANQAQLITV